MCANSVIVLERQIMFRAHKLVILWVLSLQFLHLGKANISPQAQRQAVEK